MSVRRFNLQTNAYSGLSGSALSAQSQMVEAHQGQYVLADDYHKLKVVADADAVAVKRCRDVLFRFDQGIALAKGREVDPEVTWSLTTAITCAEELRKALTGSR